MLPYWKEQELKEKILAAVAEAFPSREREVRAQVERWFTWRWRNDPAPSDSSPRCALCARMLVRVYSHDPSAGGRAGLCRDCLTEARAIAADEAYPLRDMVRNEVRRALADDEETTAFLDGVANGYPELVRVAGPCQVCARSDRESHVRGASITLCAICLDRVPA